MTTLAADIRFAEDRDADRLADVHERAWREAYSGLLPYKSLNRMIARRDTAWWRRTIRGGAGILACQFDGSAIGYATLGRNRTAALSAAGEIYELYLAPEYQGLGFGKRLFSAGRKMLRDRGVEGLVVWSLEDNDRAMNFYRRLGGLDRAEGHESFEGQVLTKIAFVWP